MSMVYSKLGAVYFDLNSLVGKAFNVTIWISRRKKIGYSFLIFQSSGNTMNARLTGNQYWEIFISICLSRQMRRT